MKQAFILMTSAIINGLTIFSLPSQANTFLGIDIVPNSPVSGVGLSIPHETNIFTGDGNTYIFDVIIPDGLGSRSEIYSEFSFLSNGLVTSLFTESPNAFDIPNSAFINDWHGTCNITIPFPCQVQFTFETGIQYQFGVLDRGLDGNASPVFKSFGVVQLDSYSFPSLFDEANPNPTITVSDPNSYFIGMEDASSLASGSDFYYDFQDWVIRVEVLEKKSTPETSSVLSFLVFILSILVSRKKTS